MLWFLGGSALFSSILSPYSFTFSPLISLRWTSCPFWLLTLPLYHIFALSTSWANLCTIKQLPHHGNLILRELPTVLCSILSEIPGWDTADCLINVFHPLLIRCLCSLWNSPSFHFLYNKLQPTLNKYINYLLQAGNKCSYFAGADLWLGSGSTPWALTCKSN